MILCCGEALIDMIPDQTSSSEKCLVPKSGGAVFNTAIALGRLGADVGLFTGVSDDMFGRQLTGELKASGVKCDHLAAMDAPTSLAFVELTDGQAAYTFYTDGAADTVLEAHHCPTDFSNIDAMFFGGISLCTDPTASTLAALMQRASDAGVVTMIDPNIRTSFIKDEAAYRSRLSTMLATADVIKLSDEDIAWVAGNDGGLDGQIANLSLPSSTLLLITKGADGAVGYRNGQAIAEVPANTATVADTIGAGDTFNGGFLAAMTQLGVLNREGLQNILPEQIEHLLGFANKCAAITVSRPGADPPWKAEL